MSQAPEDRATRKHWRVLPRIVLSGRMRLVSRFGKNRVKSTTWTPSTPRRAAWSRPTRRHRSARTSSRRWDRTARASEGILLSRTRGPAENLGGHICWFSTFRCLQGLAGWFGGGVTAGTRGVTGGTRGNQPRRPMQGNVYTTRNDVGCDIAREPTGRDLSGHGT